MSEIVDLVMPVLQKMQADLADVERVQAEHSRLLNDHSERLESLEIHLAYMAGREPQNTFDLNKLRQRIKAAEDGITILEPQP